MTRDDPTWEWVPRARLDARVRRVDGALLVARRQDVLELSETAATIWQLIDGKRSVRAIGEHLATEYDVELEVAVSDVVELVELFAERGLLVSAPARPGADDGVVAAPADVSRSVTP